MVDRNPLSLDFTSIAPLRFATGAKDEKPIDKGPDEPGKKGFVVRLNKRRFASMQRAEEALEILPHNEGEVLLLMQSGYFDLSSLIVKLLEKLGPCLSLKIGTLSMSKRNIEDLVALVDMGKVKELALLVAHVFSKKDPEIFNGAVLEFHKRGQKIAAYRSHAKIVSIRLADGRKFLLEGSANLRTNRNCEQLSIIQHAETYDYFDSWLSEKIEHHAVKPTI